MGSRRQCLFILSYTYFAKKEIIYYLNKVFSKLVWRETLQNPLISFIVWEI